MKFNFVIGNPPYQIDSPGDKTADIPIYHHFLDAAFLIANKVELITPARFLFNAGSTPKTGNQKMLNDQHFKVLKYVQKSDSVFPGTDIKGGGVIISYHDLDKEFGKIGLFTSNLVLSELASKVRSHPHFISLAKQVHSPYTYQFTETLYLDYPHIDEQRILTLRYCIVSNCFEKLENIVFFSSKPADGSEYCQIYGIKNRVRQYMGIKKKYIKTKQKGNKYKVILPASNGSGAIGEVLSTPMVGAPMVGAPMVGAPMVGHSQTFISIGAFDSEQEAEHCLKYVKTKFARTMLGVLKITQQNKQSTGFYVPQQDFSNNSDIKWDCSIEEIDEQLYKKYKLTDNEVDFIEANVREMS